jgi:hypothetical protein
MLQYSSYVNSVIIQLQVTPAVHCIYDTPNNMPCKVMKNNTDEMYFTPFHGGMYLEY